MRLYEFAKKYGLVSKELLELLRQQGFSVKSHMSVLQSEEQGFLEKKYLSSDKKAAFVKEVEVLKKDKVVEKEQEDLLSDVSSDSEENNDGRLYIEPMLLSSLSAKINIPVNDLIVVLLREGIVATKNQVVSEEVVKKVADIYEIEAIDTSARSKKDSATEAHRRAKRRRDAKERMPVVVVLGHVDHGKTTLLDYIRKSRVALKEKGGITQHIGAYEVETDHGNIVFIDTPGHAAFSKMRQRGVRVADIAILLIAADDGIMPQTIEAISQAKSMDVPIIVAINKIDKAGEASVEKIKQQLAQHDLLPEDWGGDVIVAPISAKVGTGVDQLLEMVVLQAQMIELYAHETDPAQGYVLESKLERGRGVAATIVNIDGTIRVGDYFLCGTTGGRVNSIVDSYGKKRNEAGPSIPVQITGFNDMPKAGDLFRAVEKKDFRKGKDLFGIEGMTKRLSDLSGAINVVIKAGSQSSLEAVIGVVDDLVKKFKQGVNIVHSAVGDISEGDVDRALNAQAIIIGFHVKTDSKAARLSRGKVSIFNFDIIYKLSDFLAERIEKIESMEVVDKKVGEAVVLKVFNIKGVGVVAGSYVKSGKFVQSGKAVVFRDGEKIGEGKITSLQREKKIVKEALSGFECGIMVAGYTDWLVDDVVHCFSSE